MNNMNEVNNIVRNIFNNKLISSIIIIITSFILYNLAIKIINSSKKSNKIKFMISSKSETYLKMISNTIRYAFVIFTGLIILQINNIDVSGMLAGLGIVSIVIGLAIQDALKDIIRGFSILSDDYFSVGDVIKYENIEGVVLVIGLKTTKIKSTINQNIISIANRNIEKVEVVSTQLDVEIPLSYELPKTKAENIINEIVNNLKNFEEIKSCEYKGINKLDESSINYLIRIQCNPETKPQTKRNSICEIVDTIEKHNIEIPYKQIDIHNK